MASMRGELYAYMIADAGITGQVGAGGVYPGMAPNSKALPYITLLRVSAPHDHHMGSATGLVEARFQIDCFAATSLALHGVTDAVRDALDGYRGTLGTTMNCRCSLQDEDDEYIPASDGSEEGTWRCSMDLQVWHPETVPTF